VLASLRATVLPQFTVEVYFDCEPDCRTHPRYVLVLRDGTAGAVELEFPSARDLRAFLARSRQALTECRRTARIHRSPSKRVASGTVQATLF